MHLANFETSIPPVILDPGQEYFRDKAVDSLEELAHGRWVAIVVGNEEYTVQVVLSEDEVREWSCTCPYGKGPVCKHVVATLLAIRAHESGSESPKESRSKKNPGPKARSKPGSKAGAKPRATRKARPLTFEEMLEQLDPEDMRRFIRQKFGNNRTLSKEFLLFFADKDPNSNIEKQYTELVQKMIRQRTTHGFMHYGDTAGFTKEMKPVVQAAQKALAEKNFRDAQIISQVICLEIMKLMRTCDDSSGRIYDLFSQGVGILKELATNEDSAPELIESIFSWMEKQLMDRYWFDYGNFGYNLLAVVRSCALREADPDRYPDLLDRIAALYSGPEEVYQYTLESIIVEKITFLKTIGQSERAKLLVSKHLDFKEVREGEVEEAIARREYELARKLVADGIQIATNKGHHGNIHNWKSTLLKIAYLENDLESIRELTRFFAFDGDRQNPDFFRQWKAAYSPEEWPAAVEQLILDLTAAEMAKPRRGAWDRPEKVLFAKLAPLHIEEKQWEQFLALIPRPAEAGVLVAVKPWLAERYPAEIRAIALEAVKTVLARTRGPYGQDHLIDALNTIRSEFPALKEESDDLIRKFLPTCHPQSNLAKALRQMVMK